MQLEDFKNKGFELIIQEDKEDEFEKAEVRKGCNSFLVLDPGPGKVTEEEIAVKQQDESLTEERENFKMSSLRQHCGHD